MSGWGEEGGKKLSKTCETRARLELSNKKIDSWAVRRKSSAETFWAPYSDLMAGLLMIFALTTVIILMDIGEHLNVPTQEVKEWERVVKEVYTDQDLRSSLDPPLSTSTMILI